MHTNTNTDQWFVTVENESYFEQYDEVSFEVLSPSGSRNPVAQYKSSGSVTDNIKVLTVIGVPNRTLSAAIGNTQRLESLIRNVGRPSDQDRDILLCPHTASIEDTTQHAHQTSKSNALHHGFTLLSVDKLGGMIQKSNRFKEQKDDQPTIVNETQKMEIVSEIPHNEIQDTGVPGIEEVKNTEDIKEKKKNDSLAWIIASIFGVGGIIGGAFALAYFVPLFCTTDMSDAMSESGMSSPDIQVLIGVALTVVGFVIGAMTTYARAKHVDRVQRDRDESLEENFLIIE